MWELAMIFFMVAGGDPQIVSVDTKSQEACEKAGIMIYDAASKYHPIKAMGFQCNGPNGEQIGGQDILKGREAL